MLENQETHMISAVKSLGSWHFGDYDRDGKITIKLDENKSQSSGIHCVP